MTMKYNLNRKYIMAIMTLLSFCLFIIPIHAAYGSIRIHLKDISDVYSNKENIVFTIYQVGEISEDEKPNIYEEYNFPKFPETAQEMNQYAQMISKEVGDMNGQSIVTNSNGDATIDSLVEGVYLVVPQEDNEYGVIAPFLVVLPYYETMNGVLVGPTYQLDIEPKVSPNDTNPPIDTEKPEEKPTDKTPEKEKPFIETGDTTIGGFVYLLSLIIAAEILILCRYSKRRQE